MDFHEVVCSEVVVVSSKIVSFEIVKGDDEYMNGTAVVKNPILLDDRTGRYVFSNNTDALIDFLRSLFRYLGYNIKIHTITRIDSEKLVPARKKMNKDMYLDLLLLIDNRLYVNMEFYTHFNEEALQKSLSYSTRVFGNQLKIGQDYVNNIPMISINIVVNNNICKSNKLVSEFSFKDELGEELTKFIKFIVINLDNIEELRYTYSRFNRWIRLISSRSLDELKERMNGDKYMEMIVKSADEYFTPGGIERAIPEDVWHQARAREEGVESVARTMLESGYSIQETSRISKIPVDELSKWNI